MDKLVVAQHPLVADKLGRLRAESTPAPEFRSLVRELAILLGVQATRGLPLREMTIQTPLAACAAHQLAPTIGLVPILRAGLGMADGLLTLLPHAEVWHLGLYRDEASLEPVQYYNKLPPGRPVRHALVLDPMLATGGSAVAAVDLVKRWGVDQVSFLGILGAPEGVRALRDAHPDVEIHLGAVDSQLDARGFIVPGLGDAGDRQFSTGNPRNA
ncbi:MAG: uracil phosphoribosyltransferase [Planctomycetes bacterium]|nr:uracil phosphoribosyltransferase [Planctomycetota bacterium]